MIPTAEPAVDESAEYGRSGELLPHERANLATIETVFPLWNRRDVEAIVAHYAEDIVWHNVAMGEVLRGKAQVRAFLESLFAALPDLTIEVTLRVPRGSFVAEEYVIRGTHQGPMFGLPPTGRRVEIPAVSMLRMADGILVEDHFYFDSGTVMRQMGLLPDASAAQSPGGRIVLGIAAAWRRRDSRRKARRIATR